MIDCKKCVKGYYDEQKTKFLAFSLIEGLEAVKNNQSMNDAQYWVNVSPTFARVVMTRSIWEPEDISKVKTKRDMAVFMNKRQARHEECSDAIGRYAARQRQKNEELKKDTE